MALANHLAMLFHAPGVTSSSTSAHSNPVFLLDVCLQHKHVRHIQVPRETQRLGSALCPASKRPASLQLVPATHRENIELRLRSGKVETFSMYNNCHVPCGSDVTHVILSL
ncbi:hypothetical protein BJV78DRAFT_1202950 [Lactifluus subvellereus]|nr:hypothetical protein BJV78DRAFT_1202950 [Lactifluus subvellereus]